MGKYRATDNNLKRSVAIKVMWQQATTRTLVVLER